MTDAGNFAYSLRDVMVVFADGALARVAETIDTELTVSRIFLVSTPGRADVVAELRATMGDRVAGSFAGGRLHVPTTVVADALALVRASGADCIMAIGGGSAIGLGKALVKETGHPLVAVPSTYSGSEMTDIWGVTDGTRKVTGRDPRVAPRLVVYDPALTHTMPASVTGPSGMNAIAHAVEALYSIAVSPVASLLAAEGMRRLATALPLLADQPGDRGARSEAMLGAHLCGRALDMTSMGLHHKLCHVLGGILGLPHALTHAVVLPYVTAYNAAAAPGAMATIANVLGASNAVRGLCELNRRLNITQTLTDLGMRPGDVDRVVEEAMKMSYPNRSPVTADGVRSILGQAMRGDRPG